MRGSFEGAGRFNGDKALSKVVAGSFCEALRSFDVSKCKNPDKAVATKSKNDNSLYLQRATVLPLLQVLGESLWKKLP